MPRRRSRRVKYLPQAVVQRVLGNELLLAVAMVLLESGEPVQTGDVKRALEQRGVEISTGYVSKLLRRLERWSVARAFKNPVNGRLLWVAKPSRTTELLVSELRKKEAKAVLEAMRVGDLGDWEEG